MKRLEEFRRQCGLPPCEVIAVWKATLLSAVDGADYSTTTIASCTPGVRQIDQVVLPVGLFFRLNRFGVIALILCLNHRGSSKKEGAEKQRETCRAHPSSGFRDVFVSFTTCKQKVFAAYTDTVIRPRLAVGLTQTLWPERLKWVISETKKSTRKITNSNFAIPAAATAMPVNPNALRLVQLRETLWPS